MKPSLLRIFTLAAGWLPWNAVAQERSIAPADLLDPAKRMAALQAFVEPESHDLEKFAASHRRLAAQELPAGSADGARYLLSFDERSEPSFEAWTADSIARAFTPKPGEPLAPCSTFRYYLFNAEGRSIGGLNSEIAFNGNVGDFNRDGQLEIIEYEGSNGAVGTTLTTGNMEVSYATIRRSGKDGKPLFAVLYDMHPSDREEVEPWGGQLADPDGDGIFEFQIGPRTGKDITPQVVFHWDGAKATWIGPEAGEKAHFRVLDPANPLDEIRRIGSAGGLGYPVQLKPSAEAEEATSVYAFADLLKGDDVSRPYRYASLAALSDAGLLDYMKSRRTVWDMAHEKMLEAAHVEKLWELEPQTAAMAYLRAHRPPTAHALFDYGVDAPDGQPAPEQGTVTVTDGPSGCFSPGGAFVHSLHCAPGDSYLLFAGYVKKYYDVSALAQHAVFDLRKIPLSDAEARRILQITWWLSRIRSQPLGGRESDGGLGSTSDGLATVEMETSQEHLRVEGTRFAGYRGAWVGVGDMSADYDRTAFVNLVVYMMNHEIPEYLGARWPKFVLWERSDVPHGADPYPPGERARIEALSKEWVGAFAQGRLPAAAAGVALNVVDEFGLKALWSDVAQMAAAFPPLTATEQRLRQLDAAMAAWRKQHGAKGTRDSDVFARQHAVGADGVPPLSIPGLEPLVVEDATSRAPNSGSAATPAPKKLKVDRRFAQFDALFAEREKVSVDRPLGETLLALLRQQIPTTLRKLDTWNDPKALQRWALEDEAGFGEVIARLAQLDRARALRVFRHYATAPDAPEYLKLSYAMETGAPVSPTAHAAGKARLTPAGIGSLLKVVRDAKSSLDDRAEALRVLVPSDAPGKYASPEIDRLLLDPESMKKDGYGVSDEFTRALALRHGGKAWPRLVEWSSHEDPYQMSGFVRVVPALAIVAQHDPAQFREPFAQLLAPQFTETNGSLDTIFWAAWRADLRALKPEMERIATSGPGDAEGKLATSSSTAKYKVEHRFHLARQIVSIWSEEDAVTRAKLLVAFGAAYPGEIMDDGAEPMRGHLQAVAALLDAEQRTRVLAFLDYCNAAQKDWEPARGSNVADAWAAFLALARAEFARR